MPRWRTPRLWEAELELLVADYDGGTKALVRFPTIGHAIVPGSQIHDLDGRPWIDHLEPRAPELS